MEDLTKRLVVRVSEEQNRFLDEAARDEGMEKATLVRVIIDRLAKGRAPLIAMMERQHPIPVPVYEITASTVDENGVDIASITRPADEPPNKSFDELNPPRTFDAAAGEDKVAAFPLRQTRRATLYNPGRH